MNMLANFLGVVMDRKSSERTAREANERFRVLVENVKDYAIYMENTEGTIEIWTPGAERIYGYSTQEAIGQHFSLFMAPELVATGFCEQQLYIAATEGRFETEGWRFRKDGRQFWANIILEALRDEMGQLIGFTNITRDMTERKQAEQELLDYQHKLEESNKSLEIFAAMASHDLKAPLRKIAFFSDHIHTTASDKLDAETLDDLNRIRKSVRHMQNLVDDFLVLARVTRKDHAAFQEVDLFQIAHKVVADYAEQIREKQARIEIGTLCTVQGDPGLLEQLLHNLIGNALKFQRPDVPPVVLIIADCSDSTWQELRVTDNGIGFPQVHAERIFEPLERLQSNHHYEGTGIGLTICKRIVEQHGGTIRAESTPGEGTSFMIRLPRPLPES
jgi:PAS domain S-box-containing protein